MQDLFSDAVREILGVPVRIEIGEGENGVGIRDTLCGQLCRGSSIDLRRKFVETAL